MRLFKSFSKNAIFESKFTDLEILNQLSDLNYQVELKEHHWDDYLMRKGPCTVSLARAVLDSKATTKEECKTVLEKELIRQDQPLRLTKENGDEILLGLREIAESYLERGKDRKADSIVDQNNIMKIEITSRSNAKKIYVASEIIAKGAASIVYAGYDKTLEDFYYDNLVLKKIYETQRESAENELKIASKLKHVKECASYIDSGLDKEGNLWLVLRRMKATNWGCDLKEYIVNGFFQSDLVSIKSKQNVIMCLLRGMKQISSEGILMRDVKPDNVLIDHVGHLQYDACWSDFGLACDIGVGSSVGENIRSFDQHSRNGNNSVISKQLIDWWYDAIKLVPRPKWKYRRPMERTFQNPTLIPPSSFDMYMVGIIFVSCSLGVDLPHIDSVETKEKLEKILNIHLPPDYLTQFDLLSVFKSNPIVLERFEKVFGDVFGRRLFALTEKLLNPDPLLRASPQEAMDILLPPTVVMKKDSENNEWEDMLLCCATARNGKESENDGTCAIT